MAFIRRDPGPCIVCGAPHTTCTAPPQPTVAVSVRRLPLPARAAIITAPREIITPDSSTPINDALQALLPAGQVTTAHYRRRR